MIVCICNNISDGKICRAVDAGATSMPQLREQLGIGTCCGKCHPHAKQVLRECLGDRTLQDQAQPTSFDYGALAA